MEFSTPTVSTDGSPEGATAFSLLPSQQQPTTTTTTTR